MKVEAISEFFTAEDGSGSLGQGSRVSTEELEHTGPLGGIGSRPSGPCQTARATLTAPLSTVLLVLANTA